MMRPLSVSISSASASSGQRSISVAPEISPPPMPIALTIEISVPSRLTSLPLIRCAETRSGSFREPDAHILLNPRPKLFERCADLAFDRREFLKVERFTSFGRTAREHVKLDLRLRARRPHGEATAIGEIDHQHLFSRNRVAFHVRETLRGEVAHCAHRNALDLRGRQRGV